MKNDVKVSTEIVSIIGLKIQYMAQRWELDDREYYKNTRYFYDYKEAERWCSDEFKPRANIVNLTSPYNFLLLAENLHRCINFKTHQGKTFMRSILDSAYMLITTKASSLDAAQQRFKEMCKNTNWRY